MNRTLAKIFTVTILLVLPALSFALQGAHDPATGGIGYTCNSCHTGSAVAVLYPPANVCTGCHSGGLQGGIQTRQFTQQDYAMVDRASDVRVNPKQTSHRWDGPDVVPAAKALKPTDPYSLNQYGLNRYGITNQVLCVRCHAVHSDSRNSDPVDGMQSAQTPYVRALNNKDQMCLDCHRQRNTQSHTIGSHPVQVSYTSASVKAKAAANPSQFKLANGEPYKNVTNPTAEMKNKKNLVVCSSCHGVHYADSDSSTFDNHSTSKNNGLSISNGSLLRVSLRGADNGVDTINLCTNCHTKKHTDQVYAHGNPASKYKIQCVDCHNAHVDTLDPADPIQTPNAYLLRRYMNYSGLSGTNNTTQLSTYRKRAVYTDANLATARWADTSGTGICQACHNLPSSEPKHTTYVTDLSKTRANCQECHQAEAPHTDKPPTTPNCTLCHGQPPQLGTSGDTANGGTAGGYSPGYTRYTDEATTPHKSHALGTGTNYGYVCNECHLGSTHNNTFTEVFLVKPVKAGPSATYTVNAPPADSTCNTVYCHSNGAGSYKAGQAAIGWNTGKAGTIIGQPAATRCATCHDNTTIATGSHTKHVTTMGYGCVMCHAATVSSNTALLPAAYALNGKHVDGNKDVQFSGTGAAVGATCSVVQCHGNGKGAAPVTVPTWGNAASGACNTCHATATSSLSTGSHTTHIVTVIGTGNSSCVTCHTTFTSETASTHADGTLTAPTCSTCHLDPYSAANNTPVWGTSSPGCGACHNGVGAFTGTGFGPVTGSHNKHMAIGGAVCSQCHTGTVALSSGGIAHMDGNIDIYGSSNPAGTTNIVKHAAGTYTTSCSSASCHASPYGTATVQSPTWGTAAGCGSCHTGAGAFTGTGSAPNTGSHNKHMTVGGTCDDCHSGTVANTNGGIVHTDGNIDVIGAKNGGTTNITKHAVNTSTLTCSTATCHASPYSTGYVTTPTWGTSGAGGCAGCHTGAGAFTGTGFGPNTGAHNIHMALPAPLCNQCHTGAVANSSGGTAHGDGNIDVINSYPANVTKHTAGTYTGKCSTSLCHGSTSPTWATPTSSAQCTKCHGAATPSITADVNTYVIAPPANIAGTGSAGTDTGLVSADAKIGAHQTHVRLLNGFSNYSTMTYRCESCHGTLPNSSQVVSHADGTSSPQGKFQNLATGFNSTVPTYAGTTCSATYCHNPSLKFAKLDVGTGPAPSWTDATYLADGGKTLANCQKCHLVPGSVGFTKQANHTGMTTDTSVNQCNACHGHNGDASGVIGSRHMDGILFASASDCNSCHDYDTVGGTYAAGKWSGGTWGKLNLGAYTVGNQGWGAHAKHINWLKTRLGMTVALTTTGQSFGSGVPAQICGTCHTNSGNHSMGATDGSDPAGRQINFGDSTYKYGGAAGTSFMLSATPPSYKGTSGTPSNGSTTDKTCSNISCHYFTTPLWSTY